MIIYRRFIEEFHRLEAQIRGLFVFHVIEWIIITLLGLYILSRLP